MTEENTNPFNLNMEDSSESGGFGALSKILGITVGLEQLRKHVKDIEKITFNVITRLGKVTKDYKNTIDKTSDSIKKLGIDQNQFATSVKLSTKAVKNLHLEKLTPKDFLQNMEKSTQLLKDKLEITKDLEDEIKKNNKVNKESFNYSKLMNNAHEKSVNNTEKLNDAKDDYIKTLQKMDGKQKNSLAINLATMKTETERTEALKKLHETMKKTGNMTEAMASIETDAYKKIKNEADNLATSIKKIAKRISILIGISGLSVTAFGLLENEINKLRQEVNITSNEFDTLIESSLRLSSATRTTTGEALQSIDALAKLGMMSIVTSKSGEKLIGTMIKYSGLTGMSTDSTSLLIKQFKMMGMTNKEIDNSLQDVAQTMLAVTKNTAMTRAEASRTVEIFSELAVVLGKTKNEGKNLVKEMLSLQGSLSQTLTPKTAQDFMQSMAEMSKGTVQGMKDVALMTGMSITQFKKLNATEKMGAMAKKMEKMGKLNYIQAQALSQNMSISADALMMFNQEVNKMGSDKWIEQNKILQKQMSQVEDLNKSWKDFTGTLRNLMDRSLGSLKNLLVLIGEPLVMVLKPILESLIWIINGVTNALTSLPKPIRAIIVYLGIAAIATALFSGGLKAIGKGLMNITTKATGAITSFLGIGTSASSGAIGLGAFGTAMEILTTNVAGILAVGGAILMVGGAIALLGIGINQMSKGGLKGVAIFSLLLGALYLIGTAGSLIIPLLPVFGAIGIAMAVLGAGVMVLSTGVMMLASAFKLTIDAFKGFGDGMKGLVDGFSELTNLNITDVYKDIIMLGSIAIMLSPIAGLLAIAGIGLKIFTMAVSGIESGLKSFSKGIDELADIPIDNIFDSIKKLQAISIMLSVVAFPLIVGGIALGIFGKMVSGFGISMISLIKGIKEFNNLSYKDIILFEKKIGLLVVGFQTLSSGIIIMSVVGTIMKHAFSGFNEGVHDLISGIEQLAKMDIKNVKLALNNLKSLAYIISIMGGPLIMMSVVMFIISKPLEKFGKGLMALTTGINTFSEINIKDIIHVSSTLSLLSTIMASMVFPLLVMGTIMGKLGKPLQSFSKGLFYLTEGIKSVASLKYKDILKSVYVLQSLSISLSDFKDEMDDMSDVMQHLTEDGILEKFGNGMINLSNGIYSLALIKPKDVANGLFVLQSLSIGLSGVEDEMDDMSDILEDLTKDGLLERFSKGMISLAKGLYGLSIVKNSATASIEVLTTVSNVMSKNVKSLKEFAKIGKYIGKPLEIFSEGLSSLSFALYALQDINPEKVMKSFETIFTRIGKLKIGQVRDVIEALADAEISEKINELANSVLNLTTATSSLDVTSTVNATLEESDEDKLYKEKMIQLADNMELLVEELKTGNKLNGRLMRMKNNNTSANDILSNMRKGIQNI